MADLDASEIRQSESERPKVQQIEESMKKKSPGKVWILRQFAVRKTSLLNTLVSKARKDHRNGLQVFEGKWNPPMASEKDEEEINKVLLEFLSEPKYCWDLLPNSKFIEVVNFALKRNDTAGQNNDSFSSKGSWYWRNLLWYYSFKDEKSAKSVLQAVQHGCPIPRRFCKQLSHLPVGLECKRSLYLVGIESLTSLPDGLRVEKNLWIQKLEALKFTGSNITVGGDVYLMNNRYNKVLHESLLGDFLFRNKKGFRDSDRNKKGFRDSDKNKKGFRDSDRNKKGPRADISSNGPHSLSVNEPKKVVAEDQKGLCDPDLSSSEPESFTDSENVVAEDQKGLSESESPPLWNLTQYYCDSSRTVSRFYVIDPKIEEQNISTDDLNNFLVACLHGDLSVVRKNISFERPKEEWEQAFTCACRGLNLQVFQLLLGSEYVSLYGTDLLQELKFQSVNMASDLDVRCRTRFFYRNLLWYENFEKETTAKRVLRQLTMENGNFMIADNKSIFTLPDGVVGKSLTLKRLDNLLKLGDGMCVDTLIIESCPKLKKLGEDLQVNVTLKLRSCNSFERLSTGLFLKDIVLAKLANLQEIPERIYCESLMISKCGKLKAFPNRVSIMKTLEVVSCENITVLPNGMRLKKLWLGELKSFREFPDDLVVSNLEINDCPEIKDIPKSVIIVETLIIERCRYICTPRLEWSDSSCVNLGDSRSFGGYEAKQVGDSILRRLPCLDGRKRKFRMFQEYRKEARVDAPRITRQCLHYPVNCLTEDEVCKLPVDRLRVLCDQCEKPRLGSKNELLGHLAGRKLLLGGDLIYIEDLKFIALELYGKKINAKGWRTSIKEFKAIESRVTFIKEKWEHCVVCKTSSFGTKDMKTKTASGKVLLDDLGSLETGDAPKPSADVSEVSAQGTQFLFKFPNLNIPSPDCILSLFSGRDGLKRDRVLSPFSGQDSLKGDRVLSLFSGQDSLKVGSSSTDFFSEWGPSEIVGGGAQEDWFVSAAEYSETTNMDTLGK